MSYNVTFIENARSKKSIDVDLISIIGAIKSGQYKKYFDQLAEITDANKRREYKSRQVPAIMVSALSDSGNDANADLNHTGLIAIDFDDIENLDEARSLLYADRYTFAGFRSIGGSGLCVIVKIDKSINKHLDAFNGLERYYFAEYGYQIDQSCKNANRLRFVSYDPNAYTNYNAEKYTPPTKKPGRKVKHTTTIATDEDIKYILEQIHEKNIDITKEYDDWVKVAFELQSRYGKNGLDLFHEFSRHHDNYNQQLTDRKYRSCDRVREEKNWISGIAAKYGIDTQTPETKTIQTVAAYSKKINKDPEVLIKELEESDGIAPERSREIIDAVYQDERAGTGSNDLVYEIEQYIKREYNIVYNEVTNKYEIDNRPMNDRDVNSIYLNARKIIPKATKDLIISCIESDRTKTINPIKEFFIKHKWDEPAGCIRALAESIETPNGYAPDYTYYFLRKWLVGAVAMWYKHHSPLMLVLAGETQNTGKTHFFRYLLPHELQPYYAESELTGEKDENLLMCSKALVMNDEMSNKSKRDITMIKKLCSQQWFNLRRPYGKLNEDFRRIATLAGTSNSLELLSDPTGNRRIIPIEVLSIDHDKYNAVDKTQLWVEAYQAFIAGESFTLNREDIDMLKESTHSFEEVSIEAEMVMRYVDKNDKSDGHTTTEIKNHIETHSVQRLSIKKLGMELKRLGYSKVLVRDGGTVKQIYKVDLKSAIYPTTPF